MRYLEKITLYRFDIGEYSLQDVCNIIYKFGNKLNDELPNDSDLVKQYNYFGIQRKNTSFLKRDRVDEKIKESIKNILVKGNKKKLLNEIVVCRRKLLMLGPNDMVLKILQLNEVFETIVNEVKDYLDESISKEQTEKIFELLSYYYERNKYMYSNIYELCKYTHQNDIKIVNAVFRINNIIPDVKLDIDNIKDKIKLDSVFQRLQNLLIEYGIDGFYRRLMKKMWECYDENERMFDFRNSYELILLYHLSIKLLTNHIHSDIKGRRNYSEGKIYTLARSLVDLLNVGNENKIKFLFINNQLQYILDILEHSAIYDIHQYNVNGILYLCEKILRVKEKEIIDKLQMNVDDFMYITKNIIKNVEKYRSDKVVIKPIDINEKVTNEKIQSYFLCMCTKEAINKDYNNPLSWDMIKDDSEWLIPVRGSKNQEFYSPIPNVAAWGLHDKILSIVGYGNRGHSFENVVYDLLNEKYGITVFHGKFNDNGTICETDGIIKIGSNILLIECKTKPLTRVARGGNIDKAVGDFINSYLKSQAQAMRCEKIIRKNKHIEIYNDKESDDAIKKGKVNPLHTIDFLEEYSKSIRLSCVNGNYWIMSEPSIQNMLLKITEKVKYSDNDKTSLELNEEIENYIEEKKELVEEYKKVYSARATRIMELNSLFLSFDKLFSVIELSRDKEELWDNLYKVTRVQSSTSDTWYHLKKLLSY